MDKFNNIGLDKIITSVYDWGGFTTQEAWCKFAQKINIIIEHFNYLDKKFDNQEVTINNKLDYLLNIGVSEEVAKKLIDLINDGTMETIINENLFNSINNKIIENYNILDNKINNSVNLLNSNIGNINNNINNKFEQELQKVNDLINNNKNDVNSEIGSLKDINSTFEQILNEVNKKTKNNLLFDFIKTKKKIFKVAHRGLSKAYPENTLLAIQKAHEYGCDMVEVDINYTKDNKFILLHDDTLNRTTNGVGNCNTKTLSEIKELNIIGGNNVDLFSNLKIPTLEELLITCKKNDLIPFIEIKSQVPSSLIQNFIEIIDSYNMLNNVIITSFSEILLNEVRRIDKNIVIAPICDLSLENVNKYKNENNLLLSVPYPSNFDLSILKYCNSIGLPVFSWTIDNEESINLLEENGIDGIISNCYNSKNNRKFLLLNSSDTSNFTINYGFNSDVASVSKKDDKTILITWHIPFFSNERPIAFANEDSGDKIGFIPISRATTNNTVEIKFRKIGQSELINLSEINVYNLYFNVVVIK